MVIQLYKCSDDVIHSTEVTPMTQRITARLPVHNLDCSGLLQWLRIESGTIVELYIVSVTVVFNWLGTLYQATGFSILDNMNLLLFDPECCKKIVHYSMIHMKTSNSTNPFNEFVQITMIFMCRYTWQMIDLTNLRHSVILDNLKGASFKAPVSPSYCMALKHGCLLKHKRRAKMTATQYAWNNPQCYVKG